MNRPLLAATLTLTVLLGGCVGDDEEAKAKTAISEHLMEEQEDQQMIAMEQQEADCISEGMVDGIGVDKLKEYGFLNEDATVNKDVETPTMSQGDAEVMVDSMFECTDVMATMKKELAGATGGQSPEMQACFEEALTEDLVRTVLVATFAGDEQKAQEELTGPLGKCMTDGLDTPQSQ